MIYSDFIGLIKIKNTELWKEKVVEADKPGSFQGFIALMFQPELPETFGNGCIGIAKFEVLEENNNEIKVSATTLIRDLHTYNLQLNHDFVLYCYYGEIVGTIRILEFVKEGFKI